MSRGLFAMYPLTRTRRDMMRIQAELDSLLTLTTQSVHNQQVWHDEFQTGFSQHRDRLSSLNQARERVDDRTTSIEKMPKAQSVRFKERRSCQIRPVCKCPPSRCPTRPRQPPEKYFPAEAVDVRVTKSMGRVSKKRKLDPVHQRPRDVRVMQYIWNASRE